MDKGNRYVIGDIHGCIRTFRRMVEEQLRLKDNDVLYLLGDYIDRGPDPKAVIDYILKLQEEKFTTVPLLGNHEYMLLQSLEREEYFKLWTVNGFETTLASFGIDPVFKENRKCVYEIPQTYFDFLRGLYKYAETDGYLLVHAGLGRNKENPLEDMEDLLWSRSEVYNRHVMKGRKLIHGHTPISIENIKDRVYDPEESFLNLDGGCVYKTISGLGNLIALNLDSLDLFIQENVE
jgi:serine/threonine protein phosphatase 1